MKQMKMIPIIFLSAFFSFLIQMPLQAADLTSETAGAEQARFEEQEKYEDKILKARIPKTEEKIEETEKIPESMKAGPAFELKEVLLTGNDSIPREAFDAIIQKYIGITVHFSDLQTLSSEIKKYYRKEGFIAAYVYLPPQTISNGTVEIAVIEGRLGNIEVTGNRWFSSKVIKRFLRLSPGQILSYENLRNALSFLNKHRDIKAKAVLKPGEQPKTTDLDLDVKDQFPVHFGVDVNNLGTKNTGRTRTGFSLTHTNLFGQMDQLSSRYQIGRRTWAVGADYNIPVHSSGTRVGISYTRSSVKVGGDFKALDVKGTATTYSFYILQPVMRKSWIDATFNLGFDWKSVKNKMLGQMSGHDELRILNTGLNLEFTDLWGKTYFPHSFHFGFDRFLGASHIDDPGATRPGSGGQFFIYRSSLIRYQRLPWDMMYVFRGQSQLSNHPLAPSEQLSLAGAFGVRGYPEGDYLADYGAFMTNEVYVPTYFFPKKWKLPRSQEPLRNQIQGMAFFDFGGGNLRKPLIGEKKDHTLAGMGIGLRIHMFDKVYARIQWATPTGSHPRTTGSDSAFYYGVSTEFM